MFSIPTASRRGPSLRRLTAAALLTASIFAVVVPANATAQQSENLRSYYPNFDMIEAGHYLEGFNYISGEPRRSVLWFEDRDRGRFRQYNWAPDDRQAKCHWDQLRWNRGVLRYQITRDSCFDVTTEVRYRPAIQLMPENWTPGSNWQRSGTSDVRYREDGDTVCRGENEWTATVHGYVNIAPNVQAIHVSSQQRTTWTDGQSSSGCAEGFTTNWREDYYLLPDLPLRDGGTAPAFKRSIGGNLDVDSGRWDVWFDSWQPLPR